MDVFGAKSKKITHTKTALAAKVAKIFINEFFCQQKIK
jgi:hypothetical protein